MSGRAVAVINPTEEVEYVKYRKTVLATILVMVAATSLALAGRAAASSMVAQNDRGQCNGPNHIYAHTPAQWLQAIVQEGVVADAEVVAEHEGYSPRDSSFGLWLKQRTMIVHLPHPVRILDYWCPNGKHRMIPWEHKTLPADWPVLIVLPKSISKHNVRTSPTPGFVARRFMVWILAQPSCGNASPAKFTITVYVHKHHHHKPPSKAHAWLSKLAYLDGSSVTLSGGEFGFTVYVNGTQTSTTTNAASGVNRDLGEFNPGDTVKVCETDTGGYTPDEACIKHTLSAGENYTFSFVNRKSTPPPTYACVNTSVTPTSIQVGQSVSATTKYSMSNGVTFQSVSYNWGDTTTTTGGATSSHTYNSAGMYTVIATVYFQLPKGNTVSATAPACQGSVMVSPPPPSPPGLTCTAPEEISGDAGVIVKCDVTDGNGAPISLNATSQDSNSQVSGINCYSQDGSPSCQGDGQFEFRVKGINDTSGVLTTTVKVVAYANGVESDPVYMTFNVDPLVGGF